MKKVKKKINLGILRVSPYVSKGVPRLCLDYKNFECYRIHFERVATKMIIILNQNLVEFLYLVGLEFMAPSVNNMWVKT
jgi:hypothetical protein